MYLVVYISKLCAIENYCFEAISEYAESIFQTTDGGYAVAGASISSDGNLTVNHGNVYADFGRLKLVRIRPYMNYHKTEKLYRKLSPY